MNKNRPSRNQWKFTFLAVCFLLLAALPLYFGNTYNLGICILVVYYAFMASAWNIVCGFLGELSLGHSVFVGLGGYTSTLLFVNLGWSPWLGMAAGALVAVHALSRAAMPIAMFLLPPAREDGLGHGAGKPTITDIGIGATIALVATALVMPSGRAIAAVIGAAAGTVAVIVLARRQIGGQTGDVLGAVQQIAEIGALLGVVAATPHLT